MKRIFLGVLIFAVLITFRLWMVRSIEFTNIEHVLVYRSWSLGKYGIDEFGRKFPFFFGSAEGVHLPSLSYLSVPITYFFGSSILSEIILDFIFFLLPGVVAIASGYSYLFATLLLANPIFFWPGNWEAKLLTASLLILWKLITENRASIYLVILSFVSIFISFNAWFLCPLILFIGYLRKRQSYSYLAIMIATIFLSMILIKSDNNVANYLKSNYFNFNQDVSILNSINSFRGQDQKLGFAQSSRALHNKLQYAPVIAGQSLSFLSPSFLFAVGDKNTLSNSMWVPPYLSIYFFLLIMSIFFIKDKENIFYYLWILGVVLIIGLVKFPQTEKWAYLFAVPLTLIISRSFSLVPKYMSLIILLGMTNLFALGVISGTVNSVYKEKCSMKLLTELVNVTTDANVNTVYITDDVCSDLGPGLAMLQSQKPIESIGNYFNKNIRSAGKLEIISPSDISESKISENNVLVLSDNLAGKFVENLPKKKIVSKVVIFQGSNANSNMYLIKQEPSENI